MFFERHTHVDSRLPVYFSNQNRSPKEPKYEFHWHETGEWVLVQEGCVEIRINDTVSRFEKGDLIFINPQHPHCFSAVDGDCRYWCMIPDNSILSSVGIDIRAICAKPLVRDDEIKALYCNIVEEYEKKEVCYQASIRAAIIRMTALLARRHSVMASGERMLGDNAMRITKDAIRYMEEHYAEEFSGEELASYLGFSRSYLCHVISKVTGQSLTENLLYIRCRKARELLKQGAAVGDAAFRAGFRNTSYFCRTYKRMMGESPSAHRRR